MSKRGELFTPFWKAPGKAKGSHSVQNFANSGFLGAPMKNLFFTRLTAKESNFNRRFVKRGEKLKNGCNSKFIAKNKLWKKIA